ncbi:hypothetical protein O181_105960 [Austropuccinia psidii MF-1]|uniref:Zn(2)-C6 fungal-type domain-containing protein n=1 Tax=Austropuccinia psidii MF-1 TaxID=1389203 RepID=A0A9Q3JRH5_9BASI|nr:hypothetical protein [Austropuccinia psidii MF-1]
MTCTLCTKRGIPCIRSLTTTDTCDACQKAHKKCLFVVRPFRPRGQRSSRPRHPCEDSFVVNDDETISKRKWTPGPQAGQRERFRTISPVPSSIDLSTPLLGHHPMVTSLLDLSKVIIRPMKDGNGKRTFKLGLIVTDGIQTPNLPCEQTPQQPTPSPSGTQWSEELFREHSQTKEPPIPGPSPLSQPPEDNTTREPEPEVAPTQSTEEPFGKSQFHFFNSTQLFLTPPLTISSLSRHSPLHNNH